MARPKKWRRVCSLPKRDEFGPLLAPPVLGHAVDMTVEEFEAIRLIDLEGMTQEECADKMDIARTTVQGIYADARKKIAEFIVQGKKLKIKGGDYELCTGSGRRCGGRGCRRHGAAYGQGESEGEA